MVHHGRPLLALSAFLGVSCLSSAQPVSTADQALSILKQNCAIRDLKQRGLLDETLVMWHTEFGRMPISQKGVGRDHNPGAMSLWMAGAGIRSGQVIGSSDDFGYKAVDQPVSYHDVHATMLHLMGMDHKRLTYLFNGRQMRLTDVHGELIHQLV